MDIIVFGILEILNMKLQEKITWLSQFYSAAELSLLNSNTSAVDELYQLTQPKKVPIGSLSGKVNDQKLLVASPDGWVPVTDCVEKIKDIMYNFTFASGRQVKASFDHLFQKPDLTWHYAKDLTVNDILLSKEGYDTIVVIDQIKKSTKVYDLAVNHKNHRYYTNDICSHNTGKSLFMQNISVNWFSAGLNGLYLTLELSEGLSAMRIDAMVANCSTKSIFKNLDDVELKIRMAGKKAGKFQIKYMPAQSTVNDIRAYIKEFEIQTTSKVDFLMVDYLDLLMPVGVKVSPENLFVKDKYVSEELRNLAKELNVLFITASQLNRNAVDEVEFDHSHISGGISKINTADNVFGIFTSRAMRESGKYQLQLLKTRSSSGVGTKVDLVYDVESLRIVDAGEQESDSPMSKLPAAVLSSLKTRSKIVKEGESLDGDTGEITAKKPPVADIQSKKLSNMLSSLKSQLK